MIIPYLETLPFIDERGKRKVRLGQVAIQFAFPIMASTAFMSLGVRINERSNLVSLISIITGLMCAVAVLLFEIRTSILREDKTIVSTDEKATDELFHLCCWLISIGIIGALILILPDFVCSIDIPRQFNDLYSATCLFIILHFSITLASFATRFSRVYIRIAEHKN